MDIIHNLLKQVIYIFYKWKYEYCAIFIYNTVGYTYISLSVALGPSNEPSNETDKHGLTTTQI